MMDLGLFPIYGAQPQPQTQPPEVLQMMKHINAVSKGNQTEVQREFVNLFWNAATNKDPLSIRRKSNDTEALVRYECLADTYGKPIANFLLGHVFLADDHANGVEKDDKKVVEYLGNALEQGFKPAEDGLIRLYSGTGHVSNNSFLDADIEFAGRVLAHAAQRNNPTAHFLLGAMHLFLNKSDKIFNHLSAAVYHFKMAFDLGHQEWNLNKDESEAIRKQADVLWDSENILFRHFNSDAITLYKSAEASGNQQAKQKLAEINGLGLFDSIFGTTSDSGRLKFIQSDHDLLNINK